MHHARRLLARLAHEQGRQVRRLEGQPSAHREVSDDTERVEVAAPVERLARGLFRAHEVRRPHDSPGVGGRRVGIALRDAEVGHQRAAGGRLEQDVVRLHVAVHDAAAVRVGQRPCHLAQHARRLRWRQRPAGAEPLAQCLALHVAHDEKNEATRLADAMDRDDVRVREPGRHARLAQEPLPRRRCAREVRGQDLDGDVAIQLHVAREVNHAHAAAAELALEGVLAGQRGLQIEELGGRLRHDVEY